MNQVSALLREIRISILRVDDGSHYPWYKNAERLLTVSQGFTNLLQPL